MFSNLSEPFDVDKYTTPGIFSWKPKNTTKMVYIIMFTGGFGGGGGASRASGAGGGGAGGRGGFPVFFWLPPSLLKIWYEITVGSGGLGGAADTIGTVATGSSIRPLLNSDNITYNYFVASGGTLNGGAGFPGTVTAGGAMGGNTGPTEVSPLYSLYAFRTNTVIGNSSAGGFPTPLNRDSGTTGDDQLLGFGTGGGGIDAGGIASQGGNAGYYTNPYHSSLIPGGAAGGGAGTNGFDIWDPNYLRLVSFGGTGGGGNNTGTGGAGGNGGLGCGGGGGGAGITGGRGGNGGNGAVIIVSW